MNRMQSTEERLKSYYPFSQGVIDAVAEVSDCQTLFPTYQEFFDKVGITETVKYQPDGYLPIEVVDIRPKEHDPQEALFYHLPMANSLDSNQLFQISTIAAALPDKRIIATGNPSGTNKTGRLRHLDRSNMKDGKYLLPLVEPLQKYADNQGIERSQEVGYSYGGLKAAAAAVYADCAVSHLVAIEPVIGKRSRLQLAKDFGSSAKYLKQYVEAAGSPLFEEARNDSASLIKNNLGLLRLTNLAIAGVLAKGEFEETVDMSLSLKREMQATIAWGSESELATHGLMMAATDRLIANRGERVRSLVLHGQRHTLANDIYLQTAIVLEGLG